MQVVLVDVFVPSVTQRCKNHCYFNHHFFKAASQEQQKQQKYAEIFDLIITFVTKTTNKKPCVATYFLTMQKPRGSNMTTWLRKLGHMMSHDCWLRCVKTFFEGNPHLPLPQSKQNCAKSCKINILIHFASSFDVSCRISGVSFCSRSRHIDISRHRHQRPRAEIPLRVSAPNPSVWQPGHFAGSIWQYAIVPSRLRRGMKGTKNVNIQLIQPAWTCEWLQWLSMASLYIHLHSIYLWTICEPFVNHCRHLFGIGPQLPQLQMKIFLSCPAILQQHSAATSAAGLSENQKKIAQHFIMKTCSKLLGFQQHKWPRAE